MENRTTADKFSPESRARGARYAWMMTIGMMLVAGLEVGVMLSCFGNFYGPIMKATGMQARLIRDIP